MSSPLLRQNAAPIASRFAGSERGDAALAIAFGRNNGAVGAIVKPALFGLAADPYEVSCESGRQLYLRCLSKNAIRASSIPALTSAVAPRNPWSAPSIVINSASTADAVNRSINQTACSWAT